MILVDANILLYAEDSLSPRNSQAREWWDARLSGTVQVCLCWVVISAFIRISTNPRIFKSPLSIEDAVERVQDWISQPCVRLIHPTARHWIIFKRMMVKGKVRANLVTDAHLAALSIEYGCELNSTDADFSRFPGLRWKNPLKSG